MSILILSNAGHGVLAVKIDGELAVKDCRNHEFLFVECTKVFYVINTLLLISFMLLHVIIGNEIVLIY